VLAYLIVENASYGSRLVSGASGFPFTMLMPSCLRLTPNGTQTNLTGRISSDRSLLENDAERVG
jgi:hypothetical protein